MLRGLYAAAAGMITETNRTDVIANNLANAATTGYKRDEAVNEQFAPMLLRRVDDKSNGDNPTSFRGFTVGDQAPVVGELGLGSYTEEIETDHQQGPMETTGNLLDMAISGNGYFVVQTPQGARYTRDGSFYRRTDGALINSQGYPVLDANGQAIILPNTPNLTVGGRGEIWNGQNLIATLGVVEFNDRNAVLKEGSNLYRPQAGAQPQPATGEVMQGVLERSNVNVAKEMVDLIYNFRVYEAGSKAVVTQDSLLDKAVNDVGRVS